MPTQETITNTTLLYSVISFLSVLIGISLFALIALWRIIKKFTHALVKKEQAFKELETQLIENSKLASLGLLSAELAHDINNPLTIIKERAGIIQDCLHDEDPENITSYKQIEENALKIEQSVERATKILSRTLDFARNKNLENKALDLNELIEKNIYFLETKINTKQIKIQTNFDNNLLPMSLDADKVQQIIFNILDNGLDAVNKSGIIKIKTTHNEKYNIIKIDDNGTGIDNANLEKIFLPFFSTKSATKDSHKGTGLGLYIAHYLTNELGGRLTAKNSSEGGAEFSIFLPMKNNA